MATILNPFNIGPSLFSTNIYSYYFPQKFGILSLIFIVLLGVSLERFKGEKAINPDERKLSETSIVFTCIGVGLVLLFFFYVFYNASDLERDSIGSRYRENYIKKIESDSKIESLSNKYGSGSTVVKKEERKKEEFNKNLQNLPIPDVFKEDIKDASNKEIQTKYADEIYKNLLSRDKISFDKKDNFSQKIENKNNVIEEKLKKLKDIEGYIQRDKQYNTLSRLNEYKKKEIDKEIKGIKSKSSNTEDKKTPDTKPKSSNTEDKKTPDTKPKYSNTEDKKTPDTKPKSNNKKTPDK